MKLEQLISKYAVGIPCFDDIEPNKYVQDTIKGFKDEMKGLGKADRLVAQNLLEELKGRILESKSDILGLQWEQVHCRGIEKMQSTNILATGPIDYRHSYWCWVITENDVLNVGENVPETIKIIHRNHKITVGSGIFVIENESRHHRNQRGWDVSLYTEDIRGQLVNIIPGIRVKTIIKKIMSKDQWNELKVGSGDVNACIRIINAIKIMDGEQLTRFFQEGNFTVIEKNINNYLEIPKNKIVFSAKSLKMLELKKEKIILELMDMVDDEETEPFDYAAVEE
jgi:hypothetical protein